MTQMVSNKTVQTQTKDDSHTTMEQDTTQAQQPKATKSTMTSQ